MGESTSERVGKSDGEGQNPIESITKQGPVVGSWAHSFWRDLGNNVDMSQSYPLKGAGLGIFHLIHIG